MNPISVDSSSTEHTTAAREPIAIVGMSCFFPGADSPAQLWELLLERRDVIQEVPKDRFDIDEWHHPDRAARGKINTRFGGFVERYKRFDPYFFGISPREAEHIDPQQRLMLQSAWEAMEDAHIIPASLSERDVGVFVGIGWNDYSRVAEGYLEEFGPHTAPGIDTCSVSGRISYAFGFRGPSFVVNTGCSSALVAVHLACESLWGRESSVALAGAAHLILSPVTTMAMSKFGGLSPDGRCKAFDARANGFVRSDGGGVVVLKPLSQAIEDGNPIYCVIRSTAINNDGPSMGMVVPSQRGQELVLQQAYSRAGIQPQSVHYVEGHGTGTAVGDPVEVGALGAVLGKNRSADRPLRIGSIKTAIGHTEVAAGLAGLMKTALALKHRTIPGNLHFETPNPKIPFDELNIRVQAQSEPWPYPDEVGLAGVSSFGYSATNSHVVLQEYRPASGPANIAPGTSKPGEQRDQGPNLLALSARSERSIRAMASQYASFLETAKDVALEDIAFTTAAHRTHHEHRLGVTGADRTAMVEALRAFGRGEAHPAAISGKTDVKDRPSVIFVFPGQGSQWRGMGRELLRSEPVFADTLKQCDAAISAFADWSLLDMLQRDEPWLQNERLDIVQPTLFAVEVALAALWRSWGIEPTIVVGHSMGEVAAAHVAGALTLEDAARIICGRSQAAIPLTGKGLMAMVELPQEQVARSLRGYEDRVSIAVSNSPRSTVISGEPRAIEEILATLEAQQVFCRKVKVDFASHSPQVEPLRETLLNALAPVKPRAGNVPMYSTVLGALVDGSNCDAKYWFNNLREPVQFGRAILSLIDSGHGCFVEMSPHPILNPAVESMLNSQPGKRGVAVGSLRREQPEKLSLLQSLSTLYAHGCEPSWPRLFSSDAHPVPLPRYAWDEQDYWYTRTGKGQSNRASRTGRHPLLGMHLRSSTSPATSFWETEMSPDDPSYLADHRVEKSIVFPAAGYLEIALAGLEELVGGAVELQDISLREALVLSENSARRIQLVANEQGSNAWSLVLSSREPGDGSWTTHVNGHARTVASLDGRQIDIPALQSRLSSTRGADDFYAMMDGLGLHYGPAFRAVQNAWSGEGEVLVRIAPPDAAGPVGAPYVLHPVLLDAALQSIIAALPEDFGHGDPVLPTGIARLRIHGPVRGSIWGHAKLQTGQGVLEGDVFIYDEEGKLLVEVSGLALQRLPRASSQLRQKPLLVQAWERLDRPAEASTQISGRWLVLDEGKGFGAALADALGSRGAEVVTLPVDHARLAGASSDSSGSLAALDEMFGAYLASHFDQNHPCRGVVHLWQLGVDPGGERTLDTIEQVNRLGSLSTVALVRALARTGWKEKPGLWLVTRGAHWVVEPDSTVAPEQAAIWGFARTLRYEHPELDCKLIDLPADLGKAADLEDFAAELACRARDEEVALRRGARYVARLAHPSDVELPEITAPAGERPYAVTSERPGILDSIVARGTNDRPPGPGQVEIDVEATGLNFRDVLLALGAISGGTGGTGVPLGFECAGRIARLGPGVEGLTVGQPVVAMGTWCFNSRAIAEAGLVFPSPKGWSSSDAAGVPISFVTSYYALAYLARLAKGERVLIHAAAGGLGLAAVQWAQHVGAEVFATAGSPEKREYLHSIGVKYVSDSRSLQFVDDVRLWTNGEGVDVVLNSLSGEFIPKSLDLLRHYGRFIEVGKRDYEANALLGLKPFLHNLTFSLLELKAMWTDRQPVVRKAMMEVLDYAEQGVFKPLPTKHIPIAEIKDAFRFMAQGRHLGKIVVPMKDPALRIAAPAPTAEIHADASYLITGGLGGLGLAVARRLVERGARAIALVGRHDVQTPAQREAIRELTAMGARVHVLQADVADASSVEGLLRTLDAVAPPLRGVVHAAGILDDATIEQQDAAKFARVMGPKVRGAWNLHLATSRYPLDFFVMYSSAASLLGSPGQSNYAAANAFMDALAQYRRTQGLPALSINWGVFTDVGLAAAQENRGARLSERGMGELTSRAGAELLEQLMTQGPAQIGAVPLDAGKWLASYPQIAQSTRFSPLVKADGADTRNAASTSLVDTVRNAPADKRQELMEHFVREQVVQVLRLELGRAEPNVTFKSLGLDSLTSLELRNRLERGTSLTLTATATWTYPTISQLAAHLLELLSTDDSSKATGEEQPLVRRSPDEPIPLMPVQERIWHLSHTPGGNAAYTAIVGLDLVGELDVPALEWSFGEISRRHSVLRARVSPGTSEPEVGPQLVIDDWAPFHIPVQSVKNPAEGAWQSEVDEELRKEAERPFDLEREHSVRARILRVRDGLHSLIAKWHFMGTGGTLSVFLKEMVELYNARKQGRKPDLPALPIEYADYACWHKRLRDSGAYDDQLERLLKNLRGAAKQLVLPRESSPAEIAQNRGRSHGTEYPRELLAALHEFANERDVTIFMTLLAGFSAFLRLQSGQQDIIIGSPLADKRRPELEHLLGNFVNTLVLRVDVSGQPTFDELVGRAKQVCLEAFSNSEVSFELIQKKLEETGGWNPSAGVPLVQVTLAMMQGHDLVTSLPLDGLQVVGMRRHCAGSKFELSVIFAETERGLMAEFEYNPDSISDQRIEALSRQFGSFMQQALALPGIPVGEIRYSK